ncbi:MAG: putative nicotinate-nucleotide pyrophosphorylase [Peptococcaceae bacterium]|jgi:nicotinate-nucleotide pyrophosphorylase (carboxylating)|nr:putative nicotinate-nucleotide pyrophosphorylase [Peptococcaceae bacterium]
MHISQDLRDDIFLSVMHKKVRANITVEDSGIVCGMKFAAEKLESLGAVIHQMVNDGTPVEKGDVILSFTGDPKTIAIAEDLVMGYIAKPSGIARAARKAVDLAQGKVEIVSGAWKKMPCDIKHLVRHGIMTGGSVGRIVQGPFIYLDKNYVRIFGSVKATLEAVRGMEDYAKVIQLRGEIEDITTEAKAAVEGGASVLMVDTGSLDDLAAVSEIVKRMGVRHKVKIAFAGAIKINDIPKLLEYDVDILDIGTQIIDAPLLDLKMDVVHID